MLKKKVIIHNINYSDQWVGVNNLFWLRSISIIESFSAKELHLCGAKARLHLINLTMLLQDYRSLTADQKVDLCYSFYERRQLLIMCFYFQLILS